MPPPDRYEPLPGIAALPGWLWRRMSRAARVALVAGTLLVIVAAVVVFSAARESRQRQDAADRRARAAAHERTIEAQIAEQRPHFGRTTASDRSAAAADLRDAIRADALRRVAAHQLRGPIRRIECERFPRTVGEPAPERDPSLRRGRYACLAVTAEVATDADVQGATLGHPYRALLDFTTGRYAFCKIAGRVDIVANPRVVTPRECGG